MTDANYLFDDEAMKQFVIDGYYVIETDFPEEFHSDIYRKTQEIIEKDGNPGNNLLPWVPEIQQVYDHPAVQGALTSILGPDYIMHAHRHPHVNPAESRGGGWHKDSYWGYRKMRDHHPRWIMGMYYPQDVTIENGPTGVIPGTQYFETRPEEEDRIGIPMTGKAGCVILIHFDLWHRAFPNMTSNTRYMMKFQFTRMSEPSTPQWRNPGSALPLNGDSHSRRAPMWSNIWDWLSGQPNAKQAEHSSIGKLSDGLLDDNEENRLYAAYTLSTLGRPAVPVLMHGLHNDVDEIKRDACYGLGPVGVPAIPDLVDALKDDSEMVRGYAAYALGDMGITAAETVPELTKLVDDPSDWVRRNLSEALGNIAQKPDKTVPALIRLMDDEDGQVRFNTAYSIGKFGVGGQDAVPALKKGLSDENRYVQGHAASALETIGTPEAVRVLMDLIHSSRWCPVTTRESTF